MTWFDHQSRSKKLAADAQRALGRGEMRRRESFCACRAGGRTRARRSVAGQARHVGGNRHVRGVALAARESRGGCSPCRPAHPRLARSLPSDPVAAGWRGARRLARKPPVGDSARRPAWRRDARRAGSAGRCRSCGCRLPPAAARRGPRCRSAPSSQRRPVNGRRSSMRPSSGRSRCRTRKSGTHTADACTSWIRSRRATRQRAAAPRPPPPIA